VLFSAIPYADIILSVGRNPGFGGDTIELNCRLVIGLKRTTFGRVACMAISGTFPVDLRNYEMETFFLITASRTTERLSRLFQLSLQTTFFALHRRKDHHTKTPLWISP